MYPARCPNPSCRHAFASDHSGSVDCPLCGTVAVIVLDVAATVDPTPAPPPRRDTLPETADVPLAVPVFDSTIDLPAGADTASFSNADLPAVIGRFAVRAKLGEGAFGDVYRAHDPQLDREVALKVAKPGKLDSPERVGRFLREARAAANLRHPHIVPVYDSGRDGDRHYIASGFIDGRTLEAEIEEADGKPLDLRRAATVMRELAEALGYAHKQGVVHRDVKPANVLVDTTGEPSLTDFGLAVRAGDEAVRTQDGKVMGTPAYMSPEQAAGKSAEATAASDQYALGIMLYEMATGRRPFEGPMELVIFQQIQVEPRRPRSENRAIPKDLETVILKCLEKDPGKRYANCEALAEDLRRFLVGEPVTARRIGPAERFGRWAKRNPAVAGSVSFGVLALLIGTIVSLAQANEARWQAKLAKDAGENEATQKKLADDKADEAIKAAKRADDSRQLADGEARKARAEAKDNRRLVDLTRLRDSQTLWQSDEIQSARDTLSEIATENRCIAWGLLSRQYEGGLMTLNGHAGAIWNVSMSRDATRILTSSSDGTRVWDGRTGRQLQVLPVTSGAGYRLTSISPDGEYAYAITKQEGIWAIDTRNGQRAFVFQDSEKGARALAISGDGSRIAASIDSGKTIMIWNAQTGERIHEIAVTHQLYAPQTSSIAMSANGSRIAACIRLNGSSSLIQVWETASGRVLDRAEVTGNPNNVVMSGDGSRVLAAIAPYIGSVAPRIHVWDEKTGRGTLLLKENVGPIRSVELSLDGSRLVTASSTGPARVWDARTGDMVLALKGHIGPVTSVAISADGSRVATGSMDQTVRIWDAKTGDRVFRFSEPSRTAYRLAMSGNGATLVSAGGVERTIQLWDARTGYLRLTIPSQMGPVHNAVFSPDGDHVVTTGQEVKLWDARTGQHLRDFVGGSGLGTLAAFSPDSTRIVTAESPPISSPQLRMWDIKTGQQLLELKGFETYTKIVAVAYSPDATSIVTLSDNGTMQIWDPNTGKVRFSHKEKASFSTNATVAFGRDGARFVTCSVGTHPRVWDARSGTPLKEPTWPSGLNLPLQTFKSVAFSPDGDRVFFAGEEPVKTTSPLELLQSRAIWAWDIKTGQVQLASEPYRAKYGGLMQLSPDGSRIATVETAREVQIRDGKTGRVESVLKEHGGAIISVAFSSDGTRVVTGSVDCTARIWDAKTGRQLFELAGYSGSVADVAITPDGRRVISVGGEQGRPGETRIWDAQSGRQVGELRGHTGTVECVTISADGRYIATGGGQIRPFNEETDVSYEGLPALSELKREWRGPGEIRVYDALSGIERHAFGTVAGITAIAISGDGNRIATVSRDRVIRVWDRESGKPIRSFTGHTDAVCAVAISNDGSRIVTGSADKTARVWDVESGQLSSTLKGHTGIVSDVAICSDGMRVITAGGHTQNGKGNGTHELFIWDAKSGQLLFELKGSSTPVNAVAVSRDATKIVSLASFRPFQGELLMWDATLGTPSTDFKGHTDLVRSILLSPDGKRLASVSEDRTVRLWESDTGRTVLELRGHEGEINSLAFSGDGTRIVTASADQTARVWDARTGREVSRLFVGKEWFKLAVNQSGTRIATALGATMAVKQSIGDVQVWDADTGQKLFELQGHPNFLVAIESNADSTRLTTWNHNGNSALWDGRNGRRLPDDGTARPTPRTRDSSNDTHKYIAFQDRITRVSLKSDQPESERRYWLTRPDPDWHVRRAQQLQRENNAFGEAIQRASAVHAQGLLALDRGHFVTAQVLIASAARQNPANPKPSEPEWDNATPGLRAEFYDGINFDRLVKTRVDTEVNWSDGATGSPDPVVPVDRFSVRWTGRLRAPVAGRYKLSFYADDGVRVWLDDKLVIDAWKAPQIATHECQVDFSEGSHRLKIEYFENDGSAGYRFSWLKPDGKFELIPARCFRTQVPEASREIAPHPRAK